MCQPISCELWIGVEQRVLTPSDAVPACSVARSPVNPLDAPRQCALYEPFSIFSKGVRVVWRRVSIKRCFSITGSAPPRNLSA